MTTFYTNVFGLRVSDRGRENVFPHDLVFLSSDPTEHHQLVLVSGRPQDATFSTLMQLSFKVDSLADVRCGRRARGRRGCDRPVRSEPRKRVVDRLQGPRGQHRRGLRRHAVVRAAAVRHPLDLTKDDADIYAATETECRATAGFLPRANGCSDRWANPRDRGRPGGSRPTCRRGRPRSRSRIRPARGGPR